MKNQRLRLKLQQPRNPSSSTKLRRPMLLRKKPTNLTLPLPLSSPTLPNQKQQKKKIHQQQKKIQQLNLMLTNLPVAIT